MRSSPGRRAHLKGVLACGSVPPARMRDTTQAQTVRPWEAFLPFPSRYRRPEERIECSNPGQAGAWSEREARKTLYCTQAVLSRVEARRLLCRNLVLRHAGEAPFSLCSHPRIGEGLKAAVSHPLPPGRGPGQVLAPAWGTLPLPAKRAGNLAGEKRNEVAADCSPVYLTRVDLAGRLGRTRFAFASRCTRSYFYPQNSNCRGAPGAVA